VDEPACARCRGARCAPGADRQSWSSPPQAQAAEAVRELRHIMRRASILDPDALRAAVEDRIEAL